MKSIRTYSLFLALSFLSVQLAQSQNWYGNGEKGTGSVVTNTVNLPDFNAFSLAIAADVYLSQGNQSVKIEAQQNIFQLIEKEVDGKNWKIKFSKNVGNHEPIKIWITVPDLKAVTVSGSGDVKGQTQFKGLGDLRLTLSGSGSIGLDANSASLDAAISGSGNMDLAGSTGPCQIGISGSGDVEAFGLQSSTCTVKISGSGDANVHVKESLEVTIAGSGDVVYSGQPRVKSKISGSGDVRSK